MAALVLTFDEYQYLLAKGVKLEYNKIQFLSSGVAIEMVRAQWQQLLDQLSPRR